MKTNLTRLALILAIAPLSSVSAQETKTEETKKTTTTTTETTVAKVAEPGTIAAAINDGVTFSILSKALKAADLESTLGTKGSYTIFAPTDEAFMKLKEGTLDKLLLPENKEKLRSLLLYHVIPGQFTSSDLKDGEVTTSNGEKVEIDVEAGGKIEVEDKKVFKADLVLSNGVMHSIGEVMVPKSLDGFANLDED
ncbi:fasciclin domain-containing protein [Luteolibacter sp. GHJ8]|uniref:Fasciclin domain-containing protein n=1 Tax=Luteolibacter rhizosphaerae TaxID=2989719 RepID=A0ABT3G0R2_9BACT|nr:fasciclin domain-containing protein [Luteolibacter rhizosphaerae]MCW1913421.1 fasciclin domain-containing protein [Luteolibacter rhizosphaerae]